MTDCLGLRPEKAQDVLRSEGFSVCMKEVRSKKGIAHSESSRVIRQRLIEEGTVELCFAFIKTEPDEDDYEQTAQ